MTNYCLGTLRRLAVGGDTKTQHSRPFSGSCRSPEHVTSTKARAGCSLDDDSSPLTYPDQGRSSLYRGDPAGSDGTEIGRRADQVRSTQGRTLDARGLRGSPNGDDEHMLISDA